MRHMLIACVLLGIVGVHSARADDEAPFQDFDTGAIIPNSEVELERSGRKVRIEGETAGLTPGYAYTIWAVIFNNPAAGGGPDSVIWSGIGFVANRKGKAEFRTTIREGRPPGQVLVGDPRGLIDAENDEIHLVVRCHGPAAFDDLDLLEEQLTTFNGGCDIYDCEDVQFAILGDDD